MGFMLSSVLFPPPPSLIISVMSVVSLVAIAVIDRKISKLSIGIRAKVVKAMAGVEGDQSKTLAVVKPTARGASIPIHYPMLSETNYGIWAVKMKIILRSLGVWSVIEGADTDDDKDQGAMVAISQAVPDDYSKFWNLRSEKSSRKQIKLSSRTGMLVFYVPALLSGVASFVLYPNHDPRLFLVKAALTIHFFKRTIEVLFVHKYSTSGVVLDSAILISLSYFSATSSMIYGQYLTQGFPEPKVDLKYPGVLLFSVGIIGNLYHHLVLASLRTKSDKEYKIPRGGLFGHVICPHYLFEVLGFIGIFFISQTLYPLCFTLGTIVYLMGRSYATRRWYISKFEDFPKDVKALVPCVVSFPPPNSLFITVMSMASLSFSVLGLFEGLGKNFEYSKFRNFNVEKSTRKQSNTVCSRYGMLAVYIPAFLSVVTFSGLFPNVGLRFLLVKSALTMHFFKRILEDHSLENITSLRRRGKERSVMAMMVFILSRIAFPLPVTCLLVRVMSVACLLFSVTGVFEGLGKNFQYSKFFNLNVDKSTSKQIRVSSIIAMLTVYTPAFFSALAFSWQLPNVGIRSLLVKSALALHFFKRILEVLFVHKYSGGMAVDTLITITLGYFTTTSITIYALSLTEGFPEPPVDLKHLGVVLFLVGIVGNFYHHLLLASLRTKNDKGYKVPKGGLFGLVACPHYFFEILIFLGICFISQTLYSFASTISTICYLMGRSYATRRWYLTKFDDFPKDVKAIIPCVF
ncbi:hypothetical protein SADUNF_Sadunf08G0007900 [Salix dunnii]|uniref:3-oxo-5-alpha-steroid 4-dehydrogenase C-terminal domain-containing protein n=1 Tax=Salix dunnii TaxID=1413687 RepID=A0A835JYY8_9ROSI|nr:hypothetical protein SADUNF_Sadunf08G0007900 [Salix dunnii]